MGTLRGFPNPPATGFGEQSSPAPTRSDPLTVPSLRSGARAGFVIGPACRPALEGGSDVVKLERQSNPMATNGVSSVNSFTSSFS